MKTILLSLALFLAVTNVDASNTKNEKTETAKSAAIEFSGVVVDNKTQEALAGVKVELEGTGMVAYTDFDGNYTFNNVEPGDYQLVTSYVSYESKKESVCLANGVNKSIRLKAAE